MSVLNAQRPGPFGVDFQKGVGNAFSQRRDGAMLGMGVLHHLAVDEQERVFLSDILPGEADRERFLPGWQRIMPPFLEGNGVQLHPF